MYVSYVYCITDKISLLLPVNKIRKKLILVRLIDIAHDIRQTRYIIGFEKTDKNYHRSKKEINN